MRSTRLILAHVAVGHRVPVQATVESIDEGSARVTVGAVSVVLTVEQVVEAERAVGDAERWDARVKALSEARAERRRAG